MISGYFDGAYLWDEGHASYGCLLMKDGKRIYEDYGYLGASRQTLSVNCAEYAGLISLLKRLLEIDADDVTIYGDSKLVIQQMRGSWKARGGPYVKYYIEAAQLRNKLPRVTYRWIPRAQNTNADDLTKIPLQPYYRENRNELDELFEHAIADD